MGRVEDASHTKAVSVVQATTSLVSSGSVLPQEKLKLAHKLLSVSCRLIRVLMNLLDRVVYTDLLAIHFLQEVLEQKSSQLQDDLELNALRE